MRRALHRHGCILCSQAGSALALVLLATILLSALVLTLSVLFGAAEGRWDKTLEKEQAAYTARAGFERFSAERLIGAPDWTALADSTWFLGEAFSRGSYDVSFQSVGADTALVDVTGHWNLQSRALQLKVVRSGGSIRISTVGDDLLDSWLP